jgi:uncharacterized membrane protein (DUF4010 family)
MYPGKTAFPADPVTGACLAIKLGPACSALPIRQRVAESLALDAGIHALSVKVGNMISVDDLQHDLLVADAGGPAADPAARAGAKAAIELTAGRIALALGNEAPQQQMVSYFFELQDTARRAYRVQMAKDYGIVLCTCIVFVL